MVVENLILLLSGEAGLCEKQGPYINEDPLRGNRLKLLVNIIRNENQNEAASFMNHSHPDVAELSGELSCSDFQMT